MGRHGKGLPEAAQRLGQCECSTSPGIKRLNLVKPGCCLADVLLYVVAFQHFLCYVCKEYVEDLAKIPKSFLQVSFLSERQWPVRWGEL